MPTLLNARFYAYLLAIALVLTLCTASFYVWRADRRDRAQLAAELASTKQLLAAADARQHDRDAQLAKTLATLATEKRAVVTPAQILRELPKQIPLPAPITLQADHASSVGAAHDKASADVAPAVPQSGDKPAPDGAFIPRTDLKPLYDFTLDCQACQAKLSVAQNDLTDEKAKTAALTRERDDAVRMAKGGNAWRRMGRAAKWFLFGATAGVIASKAAH